MERIAVRAQALLDDIISFWKNLRDDVYGGYYGYMSQELEVDKTAEKGCILNSRILWFFSEAAMLTGREDLRKEADHAYAFLTEHCLDKENGGVFWSLTYDGLVLDDTKHTYNQGFAIYALSSYYRLTGKQEALDTAFSLFRRIEKTCRDGEGYLEAFTRDWRPESNEKLSENGVLADKTMNTLPIFTLGASTSAAFSVAGKMAAREDHFVWEGFFTAVRPDFAIATRAWLPLALIAAVIVADYQIGLANSGQLGGVLIAAAAAMGFVWLCAFGGCYALLGRFSYSKAGNALMDGMALCLANPRATLVWLVLVLMMPALYRFVPPLYY